MLSVFIRFPLSLLFLSLVVLGFALSGCVVDAVPFWLREGTYAQYEFHTRYITWRNDTLTHNGNGIYGWRCTGIIGYTATLEVMINISGLELVSVDDRGKPTWRERTFEETYEVDVDVETHETCMGGECIGIIPYWMSTDVEEGEPISNFTSYGNLTLSAVVYGVAPSVETPYETFKGDELWLVGTETIQLGDASQTHSAFYYEKESGLLTKGSFVDNIWYENVGVRSFVPAEGGDALGGLVFELKDTNIQFRPEPPSLLGFLLPYILIAAITIVGISLVYIVRIKRKRTRHYRISQ